MVANDQFQAKAKRLFFKFLDETSMKRQLKKKMFNTLKNLYLIAHRIKDKLETKHSKVEVLINYWD